MKLKEKQELKAKPAAELEKMIRETREKVRVLKLDLIAGKVKNVAELRALKKNIARLYTILKQQTAKS